MTNPPNKDVEAVAYERAIQACKDEIDYGKPDAQHCIDAIRKLVGEV